MDCQKKDCSFEYGYGLFVYNSSFKESMSRFKYQGRQEYAAFYAKEMVQEYGEWMLSLENSLLIPVPIHKNRLRKRGYNQAELLAKELEKLTGIPMNSDLLVRYKDTLPQKELSDRQRMENLKDAFNVNEIWKELNQIPECVIIIDDIYTTGCTLETCSKVLKTIGIYKVYFLCVCIGKGF